MLKQISNKVEKQRHNQRKVCVKRKKKCFVDCFVEIVNKIVVFFPIPLEIEKTPNMTNLSI